MYYFELLFHLKTCVHKNAIAISDMKSTLSVLTTLTRNGPLDTLSSFTHRIVAMRVLDMIYHELRTHDG
jgi:hypothetical protein